ncbi:thermonuclease family protein [Croceicoccus ponticola]|uniref:Thermonuclease family protein n=1 Tax=Croceicoccus ponticola TaxID=2217664 RepID=A0A437GZG2_9SPHN|nr:thermonuclease family protein [Croceicoccus ponticola]RVQ68754.1 thermonuclease family protein [Croceicoccus ponticola]
MSYRKPFRAVPITEGKRYRKARKVKKRSQRQFYAVLATIAAGTVAIIIGMFFYYRPSMPATHTQSVRLTGPNVFECRVSSITDGDTLRCWDGSRVRLNAVAARETNGTCSPGHPCPAATAEEATDKLRELAGGQTLQCRQTGTSFNRKAAICVNESGVEINCAMVKSGTALIWPKFATENPICVY